MAEDIASYIKNFSSNLYWDTRNVTDMSSTFARSSFNGRIGHLTVSRVTTFKGTFEENDAFDQPLDTWDVSSAMDMSRMFIGASTFAQSLGSWDVARVVSFEFMFSHAGFLQYETLWPWRLRPEASTEGMFSLDALVLDRHSASRDLLRWLAREASPDAPDLLERAREAIGDTDR